MNNRIETLLSDGMKLASDIEAVGFEDSVNSIDDIHCLCSIDISNDKVYLFHDNPEFDNVGVFDPYDEKTYVIPERMGTLEEGIAFWEGVTGNNGLLIIHNARTYDEPVINKIWPDNKIDSNQYWDTFIQSKTQWFERPCPKGAKSAHGLKAYGIKSGVNKPEVTDWKTMDSFKLHRVIEDCKIQAYTYKMLEAEREYFLQEHNINFLSALKIENLYATECWKQERTGVKVDVEYYKKCIKDLDVKIEDLRIAVEPYLPPTIKGTGSKVSRKEMAELFGYNSRNIKETYVERKKDGEVQTVVVKPYFKPTINYTRVDKIDQYSGFNISYGESPTFIKKKDLTAWIKENHPETVPKDWDIEKVVKETTLLNKNTYTYFDVEETDTDIISGAFTRISIEGSTMSQSEVVKGFLIKLGWKDAEEWNLKTDAYDNKIKVEEETVVRWPPKAHPDNQMVKVIKKGGLLVSSPKLSEEDYDQLPEGIGKQIAQYNTYAHRRRFLENPKDPEEKGILSYVRPNGRIPAGVNNFNTRSGRASHRVWVNAPSESALYGEEIRKGVIPEDGYVFIGIDMKSAQLSIAAYYANNYEYYNTVASGREEDEDGNYLGESAHCVNARMFGMVSEQEWMDAREFQNHEILKSIGLRRKKSKGGSFAVIFGASGSKVGKTIGIPEREGHSRKEQFLRQMGLDNTIKVLSEYEDYYKYKRGFMLPLAFGYYLWNNSSHKSVNTIVQGFEALAQKLAIIRMSKELDRKNYDHTKCRRVMDYHDEALFEVLPQYADDVGRMYGQAYDWAANQIFEYHKRVPEDFANFGCPKFPIELDGGYKIGNNYYECH